MPLYATHILSLSLPQTMVTVCGAHLLLIFQTFKEFSPVSYVHSQSHCYASRHSHLAIKYAALTRLSDFRILFFHSIYAESVSEIYQTAIIGEEKRIISGKYEALP